MRNVPQDTPPSGYPTVPDDQATQMGQGPGDQPTRVGATPPSTERPTAPGGQQTVQGDAPSSARDDQQERLDATRVTNERPPAEPSGGEDDEYRWHTERTARSEDAESDAVEF